MPTPHSRTRFKPHVGSTLLHDKIPQGVPPRVLDLTTANQEHISKKLRSKRKGVQYLQKAIASQEVFRPSLSSCGGIGVVDLKKVQHSGVSGV